MTRDNEALRCVYCLHVVNADDDAQRIERKKYAHTACTWAAAENDTLFFLLLDFFVYKSEQQQ